MTPRSLYHRQVIGRYLREAAIVSSVNLQFIEFARLLGKEPVREEVTLLPESRRYIIAMDTVYKRVEENMLQRSFHVIDSFGT